MSRLEKEILTTVSRKNYKPQKVRSLANTLGIAASDYRDFREVVKELIQRGKLQLGKNDLILPGERRPAVKGVFRRFPSGDGSVRPQSTDGYGSVDIHIPDHATLDASTGDQVLVRITRKPSRLDRDAMGEVVEILERSTRVFVGTYFERDGESLVRVDGTIFQRSILVGDASSTGVKPDDKVVIEMLRFPTPEDRGEAVITEVLGAKDQAGVDTLTIIRSLGIPDAFPEEVLAEARQMAANFREEDLDGREDFTNDLVITIDPIHAKDFDDAVSVTIDPETKHWHLTVHIADVAHFAPVGGALDREARRRATSVYLPQKVIPMFPELISNGLASLQQGKLRYVKSVVIEWTPGLQKASVRFANGAIRVKKRFAYEQVSEILQHPDGELAQTTDPEILKLLKRMKDLALLLRKKRFKRGALEMDLPEASLEFDAEGKVNGAHFAIHDISHQMIEECMLAANEAVAEHFTELDVPFLRRVHPAPNEEKMKAFGEFASHLGYPMEHPTNRFEIQRILRETSDKPERHAIHYALLRSLKQAVYSPIQEEHFALASQHYCHFTSPIRRYPDLSVHRQLGTWIKHGKVKADETELIALGEHCSKAERRAETAERELIKLRLLTYLSEKVGLQLDAIITGVAEYGFYAQGEMFPAEGLVHIRSLVDDYYAFDSATHSLEGKRSGNRYQLGDRVRVEVVHVDMNRRQLDLRLVGSPVISTSKKKLAQKEKRRKKR